MTKMHLAVYQPNVVEGEDPTQCVALYNPGRYDYRWNSDFTAFRAIKLTWWDDRSYIAYQSGYDPETGRDLFHDEEDEPSEPAWRGDGGCCVVCGADEPESLERHHQVIEGERRPLDRCPHAKKAQEYAPVPTEDDDIPF